MKKIKLLKKGLVFLLLSVTTFIACTSNDDTQEKIAENTTQKIENELTAKWKNFEESVMITLSSRVTSKSNNSEVSARTIIFKNFNPNFNLESTYIIDGYDYTDDGKINDLVAGDGIYTSVILLPNLKNNTSKNVISQTHKSIVSSKFKYNDKLLTSKIGITCKMRITYKGETLLGFSCKSGCIELYDCELDFSIF